jgi:hypothetical protein
MIEGALMGYGDLVELPDVFHGVREDCEIRPKVTVGQMLRLCKAMQECTRIINDPEFDVFAEVARTKAKGNADE